MNKCLIILLVSIISITAFAANAQEGNWLSILVNVTTKDQRRIAELGPKNFRATLNRKPVEVIAVRSEGPQRLVLLLDASPSVIDNRIGWRLMTAGMQNLIAAVPKDCSIGLIVFGARILREVELHQDRQRILAALDDVGRNLPAKAPSGPTALFDAIKYAINFLGSSDPGDAIYIATDADDKSSKTKMKQLRDSLLRKQIRVFTYLLGDWPFNDDSSTIPQSLNTWPSLPPHISSMRQLSLETTGYCYVFSSANLGTEFPGSGRLHVNEDKFNVYFQDLAKLNDLVSHYYRLDLRLNGADRNSILALDLLDQSGHTIKNAKIVYNPELFFSAIKRNTP